MCVMVMYDKKKYLGRVTDAKNGYYALRCLERPFGDSRPKNWKKNRMLFILHVMYIGPISNLP